MGKVKDSYNWLIQRKEFYTYYMNKYYNMFMNRHIIEGELDYQQIDYLMKQIWSVGSAWEFVIKIDDIITPVITPYSVNMWNIYDYPISVIPINTKGVNFIPYNSQQVDKDGVIIYGQRNHKPVKEVVDYYARKIASIEVVIQMNMFVNKTPFIIGTSLEDERKANELWDLLLSDNPKLIWSLSEIEKVKSLISGAPYIIDKLYMYKQTQEDELREVLGFNNLGVGEKKEHLISSEIEQNNEVVSAQADCFLDILQESFERANKVLGLHQSIRLNKPISLSYEEDKETEEEEDTQDEE